MPTPNLAIVSDKLAGAFGGAEAIVFLAHKLYPTAPIYTTLVDRSILPEVYKGLNYRTTFLQNAPGALKYYKAYFPLMPLAHELLNLQEFDVIFSSHHSVAKGIIPRPDAKHICYCHSPARYIWDMFYTYTDLAGFGFTKQLLIGSVAQYLRMWDITTANNVDTLLANSRFTAQRIKRFWNRESEVLYPPVNTTRFTYGGEGDFYLMAGRMVAYKGFELAVDAFNESGKKLIIVGDGPEYERLKAKAKANVVLTGRVSDEDMNYYMGHCKGFVFPGKEDFGIVMVEAQSAGKPVIALNAGGAVDIVVPGETGILMETGTTQALNAAIAQADATQWNRDTIRNNALRFDESHFARALQTYIEAQ